MLLVDREGMWFRLLATRYGLVGVAPSVWWLGRVRVVLGHT